MASMTNFMRDATINWWFRGNPDTITAPSSVTLALYTTPTDATGAGTEVVAGAHTYSRQTITFADPAGTGDAADTADITFTDWPGVTATHWAIHDGTTGDMLLQGAFSTPQTAAAGTALVIAAGDLALQAR